MTKRFKVHKMIEGQTTAEDVDVDFLKELLAEGRLVDDLTMHIEDTKEGKVLTYRECVDLLNDMCSQIRSFKPIATEAIGVTSELNAKYQSSLTSIGAFKEFLNETRRTFGDDFRFLSTESLFEMVEERFNIYCECQLMKLEERWPCGQYYNKETKNNEKP